MSELGIVWLVDLVGMECGVVDPQMVVWVESLDTEEWRDVVSVPFFRYFNLLC